MFNKKIISTFLVLFILSGCTGLSIPQDNDLKGKELVQPVIDNFETSEPAIIKRRAKPIKVIQPNEIPQKIKDMPLEISLSNEARVSDLPSILEEYGIYLLLSEEVDAEKTIYLNNFKGELGDLFEIIGSVYNLSFNYQRSNIISIDNASDYVIDVPQNSDIISELENAISPLGAQDINASLIGGTIMYKSTYLARQKIEKYLQRFSKNASVIGLQVAVLTVQLDKNNQKGFDWSQLNASIGKAAIAAADPTPVIDTGITGGATPPASTEPVGSDFGTSLKNLQTLGQFSGSAATLRALNGTFDITAVINYLSTYGQTRTNQSVSMKTLSGKDVTLKSVQSIPYVSGVNNTSTGSNNSSNAFSSGADTDEIEVGLTLNMVPYYDSDSGIVTVEVELELSSLIAFVELSAGNQIGKLTQPQTQEQNFTNFMKLKAGETSIIGGVTYESITDNRSGISYIETANIASQNKKITKNAVFIILRPTVTMFGDFDKEMEVIQ